MLKNLQFLVIHFSAAMKSVHHWTKWKSPCLLCVYKSACALFFVAFSSCFVACYTLTYTWLKNEDQATPECGLSSRLSVDLPCLLDAFTLVWLSTGWLILFPVPSFSCPEKPQRRHPGGISTRCPNDWTPHPLFKLECSQFIYRINSRGPNIDPCGILYPPFGILSWNHQQQQFELFQQGMI